MEWNSNLVAIRILSTETVHVAARTFIGRKSGTWANTNIETYCGVALPDPYDECSEEDINCEMCVTAVEQQQAYWREFWSGPDGIRVIKLFTGLDKLEEKQRENERRADALIREMQTFNNLLQDCLKHRQPVFTLELPDEVLLSLVSYGSVGEVLLAFKMSEETRQSLQTKLGKAGFALLGSRLIAKGFLKANDPIFNL